VGIIIIRKRSKGYRNWSAVIISGFYVSRTSGFTLALPAGTEIVPIMTGWIVQSTGSDFLMRTDDQHPRHLAWIALSLGDALFAIGEVR
jgi:hypothetical protein